MVIQIKSCSQSTIIAMNTTISYRIFGENSDEALQAAVNETYRLEDLLSRFRPGSDISRINNFAGIKSVRVSTETNSLLTKSRAFSKYSRGCFDVTIGALSALWAKARENYKIPDVSEIQGALPLANYRDLTMHNTSKTAGLKKKGQSIDLGGIAKGYAADRVIDVFRKRKITSAYANFGGNVAVLGAKPDGSPWRIGIMHPRHEGELIGAVSVINKSVVTSGDYQRCFIGNDGKRYHHILNPKTGYPSEAGLISASIVANNSLEADALSTILFLSGIDKVNNIIKAFPETDAILIDDNLTVFITRRLVDFFQPSENINLRIIN